MTVPADVDERGRAGRRERKKQRTREALIDASFELFAEKGFEATTVEEIADAVDVSSRTFFRYFSSKEDVALTFQEEQFVAMREALAAQPPGDPVVTALRKAAVGIVRACEQGELGFDPARWMCLQNLMSTSPALLAGSLEHAQKKQAVLTQIVAERMGTDPATDLRPHVVAASASCAFRAAAEAWTAGATGGTTLSEAVSAAFALLEDGINYPSVASEPTTLTG
jgi:AcrR family transcriptional regulator